MIRARREPTEAKAQKGEGGAWLQQKTVTRSTLHVFEVGVIAPVNTTTFSSFDPSGFA